MKLHSFPRLQEVEKQLNMSKYLHSGAITSELISTEIKNLSKRKDTGAHTVFLGQVRDDISEGRKVKQIDYSAYGEMVSAEAEKIKKIIRSEFTDVLEIIIVHSTGTVVAGEISMFVLVSAGHRNHAIQACQKTVELIKERLPVWKKEILEDNSYKWQENK
jgi:molybdopterin synthase catalytic subunit